MKKFQVKVRNNGAKVYEEEFNGRLISIKPGEAVEMSRREAVNFLGTYSGMDRGKFIEKNLTIDDLGGPIEPVEIKPTCNKCGLVCQNAEDLKAHINEAHPGESEAAKNPESVETSEPGTYDCPICKEKGFKGKAGLRRHLASCSKE